MPPVEEQMELIKENTAEIIVEEELLAKLHRSYAARRPLRCKLGIDPSAPDIHLGHAVVLHKMKTFQDMGHQLVIILGDFTGQIGDPTDRSETRPQLSKEEVLANARTYQEQIFKIIDREKTELLFNSQWLGSLNFSDVLQIASTCTVARMLEREDFQYRYRENLSIGIHEFFYPLMQGYDSVAVKADIEFGATEQKFNLLMGRHLQKEYGQEPQIALTMPILVGTDGVQKMSKSLGNYIGISEPPAEIYGKVMSISDEIMADYYRLGTRLSSGEVGRIIAGYRDGRIHPRDAKMTLAREIVALYHGSVEAARAEEGFKQVFQRGEIPAEMPQFQFSAASAPDIVTLLVETGLTSSRSEARRLIKQGGVRVNREQVADSGTRWEAPCELILQVGKRKFARVVIS
ncbi:MAG: tyrosine--tRNA ligase [Firmicutes bacterium]|nr:tyrosine--tRNA ligase [Bacillota bacterium]